MNVRAALLLLGLGVVTLAGCTKMMPRAGHTATVNFGVVRHAEEVTLGSTAAEGALVGGTLGLMMGGGRDSRVGSAMRGAAVGGMAGGVSGGDRRGMAYTVQMPDQSSTRIVSDQREIHVGDCVAVERVGQGANIRRVSASFCEPSNEGALRTVQAEVRNDALKCQRAKEELAEASTSEAVDLASRKIELLCNG